MGQHLGVVCTLILSLLTAPLPSKAQPGAGPRLGLLILALPLGLRLASRPFGKGCVTWAMWRGRTSSWSTALPRGRPSGCRRWPPSWSISRWT